MEQMGGYSVQINWSEEDDCYLATSEEFPNLSAFGDTYEEVIQEFQIALGGFLEVLEEELLPNPITIESFSGQFRVRLPRSLHRRLVALARREKVSLNTIIIKTLSEKATTTELVQVIIDKVTAGLYKELKWTAEPAAWAGEYPLKNIATESAPPIKVEA